MSATVNNTITATKTATLQASPRPETMSLNSQLTLHKASTLGRVAPGIAPVSVTGNKASLSSTAVTAPDTNTVPAAPTKGHSLRTPEILGIVLGSLAFFGALLAGLIFARRWMKKYRQQRVAKKQAVTEGNEMPAGFRHVETAGGSGGIQQQQTTGGSNPFFQQHIVGGTNSAMQRPLTNHQTGATHDPFQQGEITVSSYPRDEKRGEMWEEYPPEYRP